MGTRPEIIKMAPVYRALAASRLPVSLLHTGQHEDMVWPLYEFFGLRPDRVLELSRSSGSLAHLSARLLEEMQKALEELRPSVVLVQGDTTSALMAALCAFYARIPVGHVEAGLRTGEMYDPFPEERNRALIARIARWHFAPTPTAEANLLREGIAAEHVHRIGNTVVDAMVWAVEQLRALPDDAVSVLPGSLSELPRAVIGKRLLAVTAHRRENWGAGIAAIATAVRSALTAHSDLCVVWPLHPNPSVQDAVRAVFRGLDKESQARFFLCEPVNYPALLWLMSRAWLILTDSGGIQEEAISASVPVFVLRDTTERPELIEAGAGILVGTDAQAVRAKIDWLYHDDDARQRMRRADNPFGDGRAAERLRAILEDWLLRRGVRPRQSAA
jgi:UDP-N-acetylglucosamine 2-epimerase